VLTVKEQPCTLKPPAWARVLTKLGMLPEGRLRETDWFKGRWWDMLVYGILEQEWETDDEHNSGTAT
jgi:[ribosomal protein S5]-alanine N-acetyltransferase